MQLLHDRSLTRYIDGLEFHGFFHIDARIEAVSAGFHDPGGFPYLSFIIEGSQGRDVHCKDQVLALTGFQETGLCKGHEFPVRMVENSGGGLPVDAGHVLACIFSQIRHPDTGRKGGAGNR